jgi:hypothetical protein
MQTKHEETAQKLQEVLIAWDKSPPAYLQRFAKEHGIDKQLLLGAVLATGRKLRATAEPRSEGRPPRAEWPGCHLATRVLIEKLGGLRASARALGVSKTTVMRWYSGETVMPQKTYLKAELNTKLKLPIPLGKNRDLTL